MESIQVLIYEIIRHTPLRDLHFSSFEVRDDKSSKRQQRDAQRDQMGGFFSSRTERLSGRIGYTLPLFK